MQVGPVSALGRLANLWELRGVYRWGHVPPTAPLAQHDDDGHALLRLDTANHVLGLRCRSLNLGDVPHLWAGDDLHAAVALVGLVAVL